MTKEPYSDMGTKAVARGAVHFDHVRVPGENMLGDGGQGLHPGDAGLRLQPRADRPAVRGRRPADRRRDVGVRVPARVAFDQPISRYQGVSFPLAESETLLAAARVLCYQTLWLKDAGLPHTSEAAMCKWWAPKTAFDVVQSCLLLHGQYGYRTEKPIEQRLRDVLGLQIGDGTAQIMKLIIARQKLGRALAP